MYLIYLFGYVFCDDFYPCRLPCKSSKSDKNAALELIEYVFRGEYVKHVEKSEPQGSENENLIDSGADYAIIDENGIKNQETGFWKGKFRLYDEVLEGVFDNGFSQKNDDCENGSDGTKLKFVEFLVAVALMITLF